MTSRAVFIGTGSFAVPALTRLAAMRDLDLVGVVTAPDRPAGRGGRPAASPVWNAARDLRIHPVQTPHRLRFPEAVADVLALRPDLLVLADYGQIVPARLLDLPLGALNLHPSLLPRHRGAAPIAATILAGDPRTGVTLMRMDTGLDTGPVVAVRELALSGAEVAPQLEETLARLGADLLAASLDGWIRGELSPQAQGDDGATLTRPLRRDDGRLNPELTAIRLERQVRAFQPWPGSWFEVPSGRITVHRAAVVPGRPGTDPGELWSSSDHLFLATGEDALDLIEVQPAGGRPMSGAALLRGRASLLGEGVTTPPAAANAGPIERPVGYSESQ